MTNTALASPALDRRSVALRRRIVEVMNNAGRGHLASAFSLVEILRVLYDSTLHIDPAKPLLPERDRFILSKGHGCLALYVLLADKGFFPAEELRTFCRFDSMLGGHPEPCVPGVEISTGSLGHGLPVAVGMALHAKFVRSPHRVFVVLGDGECNEGSVWEAAMAASKHRLDNLVALVDFNKHQSYGSTREVLDLEPFADKWRSFGFAVREADGHDVAALEKTLTDLPGEQGKPTVIICHTVKGKGISFTENNLKWHHKSGLKENEMRDLLAALEDV
ncbi:MAG: transketolase [Betaproteobacteria bacterium]|nr:transketolase [Betaproteobacteria bacterium]